MIVRDVQHILESFAPKELAWERDNVGLQVGSPGKKVNNILVALDVSDELIAEARRKRVELLVTHHPLLFQPLRSVDNENRIGRLVTALIRNDIALYAAHTNLDFTRNGVNAALAGKLGLRDVTVLQESEHLFRKIAVFVPGSHVEDVTSAMSEAGAGSIGNYDSCSFRAEGTGTFRANEGAKPFFGTKGILERTDEVRVEMIAPVWRLDTITAAMKSAHPYEEVAYDVYDLANTSKYYGAGAIGMLPRPMTLVNFCALVSRSLNTPALRYSKIAARHIRRVAVCGGSGSDLLGAAMRAGADAFVTSDVRYHAFQESDRKIALIDAGHYETETPVVPALVKILREEFKKHHMKLSVEAAVTSRNFTHYFHS